MGLRQFPDGGFARRKAGQDCATRGIGEGEQRGGEALGVQLYSTIWLSTFWYTTNEVGARQGPSAVQRNGALGNEAFQGQRMLIDYPSKRLVVLGAPLAR